MITQQTIENIMQSARIEEVAANIVDDLKKKGANYIGTCPKCGAKKLNLNPKKKIYKCFACDWGGKSPVNFVMEIKGLNFPEALKYLADQFGVPIIESENFNLQVNEPKLPEHIKKPKAESFKNKQLKESGLTEKDVVAEVVVDNNTTQFVDVFQSGTIDQFGRVTRDGDDMIIWYYDLEGKQVTYQKEKSNKFEPLFRIRWQNPHLHLDKEGRPMKYYSPKGSKSHLYIPQIVRNAYKSGRQITRLFVQEGEKKAEKACKHGFFSVGIMGIHNIASNNFLPYELHLIVKNCGIKEVIFVLDGDCFDLSKKLTANSWVNERPHSFYKAVINFRDYFKTFTNIGIYLEIYFAHILHNTEKGIDDLLTNQFEGKEKEFADDIDFAINSKETEFTGKFFKAYKITTEAESKIKEYFFLDDVKNFAKKHFNRLKELPEFKFYKHKWKFDDQGNVVPAQPLMDHEIYWAEENYFNSAGKEVSKVTFDYDNCYNFLHARGFGRYMQANGTWSFCRIENKIVSLIDSYQIKDFVMQFTKEIAPKPVRNMLYRGSKMYLGHDALSNLDFVFPNFDLAGKDYQYLFFNEKYWKIMPDSIEERHLNDFPAHVWIDKIKNAEVKLLDNKIEIFRVTREMAAKVTSNVLEQNQIIGQYSLSIPDDLQNSHFYLFIQNTSNFFWREVMDEETRQFNGKDYSLSQKFEINLHIINKLTCIGYLLHKYRNKSVEKAVIAMDGKNSEVGESNGRTGKSLIGEAIKQMIPQVYIPGKARDIADDKFLLEEVTEKTDNIFVDDVRVNFDFEFLFPLITGTMRINGKGTKAFTLPSDQVPKIFLATNHAISGDNGSFKDRQAYMCFSDYYNEDYKPIHDFGYHFFTDWENEQWNLFYNLMAACIQLYLKHGIINPPMDNIELRKLRQTCGEDFITWADGYYGIDEKNPDEFNLDKINKEIPKIELYDDFIARFPKQKNFCSITIFKKKLKAYCKYRNLIYNYNADPNKTGIDIKSGGVEYILISNGKM